MNSFRVFCLILFASLSLQAADGSPPGGRFDARQKAESKEKSRWTLQEWLAQKERNRMMDLWLAMYAPSPYEFFLSGSYNSYATKWDPESLGSEKSYQSFTGSLGAYATIIGLEGQYENNTAESFNDLSGSLNIRVLGNAVQGTHLTLRYGLRTRTGDWQGTSFRVGNQFAGAELNLYLTKYFGLSGRYNSYFPKEDENLGSISGFRSEAGAFIDFSSFRVFGNWFQDKQTNDKAGVKNSVDRSGVQTGLRFFF